MILIQRNYLFSYAIDHNLPFPIGAQEANVLSAVMNDEGVEEFDHETRLTFLRDEASYYQQAEQIYKAFERKSGSFDWIRSSVFKKSLKHDLMKDSQDLLRILDLGQDWTPERDRQLNALYDLCTTSHKDQKLLIFTQYADTAYYLTREFKKREVEQFECVTGSSENPTALAQRFSPRSHEKFEIEGTQKELRIIITTDVLSEGQNLQDCHVVVNYDLPWAIIRLIQRAGRVDRIGQQAECILCYSFLPEDGIEQIINLRSRLTRRIRENAEVVGSDETFFDGDPVNIQDLYHEKAGLLDEDEDGEVDLASYAFQIWKNATDADPRLKKIIPNLPNVIYGTKAGGQNVFYPEKEGVIVYTRTADDN